MTDKQTDKKRVRALNTQMVRYEILYKQRETKVKNILRKSIIFLRFITMTLEVLLNIQTDNNVRCRVYKN